VVYSEVPLEVFSRLAACLAKSDLFPPFAAIEYVDGYLRYGAIFTNAGIRIALAVTHEVKVSDLINAPLVRMEHLTKDQRHVLMTALSERIARKQNKRGTTLEA